MNGASNWYGIIPEGAKLTPGETPPMRTRLVAGRDLGWTDIDGLWRFALVSDNLARELLGLALIAYGVLQRRREIGIRLALGVETGAAGRGGRSGRSVKGREVC